MGVIVKPSKLAYDKTRRTIITQPRQIIWLREIDADTDNACWVVCANGDPGAVAFVPLAVSNGHQQTAGA